MEQQYVNDEQQRTLECWLPLAQDTLRRLGSNLSAHDIERLVVQAVPALAQASTILAARTIIWLTYQHMQEH